MHSKHIAVLMGGQSNEHDISLDTGRAVADAFHALSHRVREVVVDRRGTWHVNGTPVAIPSALAGVDAVFQAGHGEWGEDGKAQIVCEHFGVPYTGSSPLACALSMDKWASRGIFSDAGFAVPRSFLVSHDMTDTQVRMQGEERIGALPWVVKPAGCGSSVGVSFVYGEDQLSYALSFARAFDERVLIEELLEGPEVSCGVLELIAGHPHPLPPTLIVPPANHAFFDYDAKYSGETEELTPAPFSAATILGIQDAALAAFEALGCRHYARVDMILRNDTPVILELNALPGLTPESIVPKQARLLGFSFPRFVEHLVRLSLERF